MGADLIGYMARGPQTFSPETLEAAKTHLAGVLAKVERVVEIDGEEGDHDAERARLIEEIPFGEDDLLFDGAPSPDFAGKAIEDFLDAWNGHCRYAATRDFGDGTRVMFIGDVSWGDSPDFDEYRATELLFLTDTLKIMGVD